MGILGPQTSAVSLEIASLGRLLDVPLISYLSTSVTLCQRDSFPNFFRTVPSDKHQAQAIVKLLKRFQWSYASFVHSDSEYGTTGYQLVKQAVEKAGDLCLAEPITIYNRHFEEKDYKRVVETLLHGKNENKATVTPKVVIVFADRVPAGKLLQAAKDLGVRDDQIRWIGSDAWASRESVVENREGVVEGAIAIQPLRKSLPEYDEYFKNLITSVNTRNPWFEEYLEVYHNCSNDEKKANLLPTCKDKSGVPFRQQYYIHFVRDAVYAFAHALHNLHQDVCENFANDKLCPAFKEKVFTDLAHYLANVSFESHNFTFKFYGHNDSYSRGLSPHDGPPRYSVINFGKTFNQGKVVYDWKDVGTYNGSDIVDMNTEFAERYAPTARNMECGRQECEMNYIKIPDSDDQCCWHCTDCGAFKYRLNEHECRDCPPGERSFKNGTQMACTLIEEVIIET